MVTGMIKIISSLNIIQEPSCL